VLEKDLLRRFSAEWLGRRAKQKRLLLLQELPDAGGSQQRSAAIRSSLFLCPSLLHASLGATFTCLSVAQFLPPREALACISLVPVPLQSCVSQQELLRDLYHWLSSGFMLCAGTQDQHPNPSSLASLDPAAFLGQGCSGAGQSVLPAHDELQLPGEG